MMHLLATILLACQAQQAQPQNDDFWYGPLNARAHGVFQTPDLGFVPDAPTGLKEGAFELHMTLSTVNVFNNNIDKTPNYLMDMEFERLSIDAWYAISDRWQVGVEIPIEMVGGGYLDDFIIGFHNTFGLSQGGRTEYPRHATEILLNGKDIGIRSGTMLGNVFLKTNYKLLNDPSYPQLILGTQLKLPTVSHNTIYDSHSVGVGLSANLVYQVADWYFNTGFSAAYLGNQDVIDQRTKSYQETLFVMVERQVITDVSVVAQIIGQSGTARSFGQYSAWSWETDLGFKFQLSRNAMFEFGAFENVVNYANSADFGIFTSFILRY